MKRKLFTLASVLSLLLCLATAALWVRSYQQNDLYVWQSGSYVVSGESGRGHVLVSAFPGVKVWVPRGHSRTSPAFRVSTRWPGPGEPGVRHYGGGSALSWYVSDGGVQTQALPNGQTLRTPLPCVREVAASDLLIVLLLGLLPAARMLKWRRDRVRTSRSRQGRCERCGYDLRATPNRCPECGHVPKKAAA